ncbi:class I SAM-dependent methyltransferase [Amycolatopsis lurida]
MSLHHLRTTTLEPRPLGDDARHTIAFYQHWVPDRTILELGANPDGPARALAAAGFNVFVVDDSPTAIEYAASMPGAESVYFVHADLRRECLEDVFGAVLVEPSALAQLYTLRAQIELLMTAADHIVDDGVVIIETPTMPVQLGHYYRTAEFPPLAELDIMAGTADLRLLHRTGGFGGSRTLSVYGLGL